MIGGGGGSGTQVTRTAPQTGEKSATAICSSDPAKRAACNAFSSAENTWEAIFAKSGQQFKAPGLQFFSRNGQSGCGAAQSAMGPFYCPLDQRVYIDLGFYDELAKRFGAPGDFAQAYVLTHEIGHHVQHLLGTDARVRQLQESRPQTANQLSVRLELQADCYAGVWAANAAEQGLITFDDTDVTEGLSAAAAVGDDRIQERSAGRVDPESWTHGSAEARQRWFLQGYQTGDLNKCDTFAVESVN